MSIIQQLSILLAGAICALGCAFEYPGDYVPDSRPATCMNDQLDEGEDCDGQHLDNETCLSRGFGGGLLACSASCTFDVSGCTPRVVPSIPVPRLPMNDAYIGTIHAAGTMQPRFAWDVSVWDGPGELVYELQFSPDEAFVADVDTISGTTPSYLPAVDLAVRQIPPVGTRYFWRVRACVSDRCSPYSRTRWVNVGRSDHDLNGDGFADIAVAANGMQSPVHIYFGNSSGVQDGPSDGMILGGQDVGSAGSLAIAPDLNGDGYSDLIVSHPLDGARRGLVAVYFGGSGTTFESSPDGVLRGQMLDERFGFVMASAGDMNGDGYGDLLVGNRPIVNPPDLVQMSTYVYFGGRGGTFDSMEDAVLTTVGPPHYYKLAIAGGDINGDGLSDHLSLDFGADGVRRALLYLSREGSSSVMPDAALVDLQATPGTTKNGEGCARAGDVNGDGFEDVITQEYRDGGRRLAVFFGAAALPAEVHPSRSISDPSIWYGSPLGSLGDVNGDGLSDFFASDPMAATGAGDVRGGKVYAYLGSAGALDLLRGGQQEGMGVGAMLGASVSRAGDVNGDGFGDFVVGSPGAFGTRGAVYLHLGSSATAVDMVPDATITGSQPDERFGYLVD